MLYQSPYLTDSQQLAEVGSAARSMIMSTEFPKELNEEIIKARPHPSDPIITEKCYEKLCQRYGSDNGLVDVAVRSSATAEDLPDASFAGQQV